MKKKAIIIGAGTYGQVYSEYLKEIYSTIFFLDDNKNILNSSINGIEVIGTQKHIKNLSSQEFDIFVPIGNNITREKIIHNVRSLGFTTPSYIHPSCQVHKNITLGQTVYMLPGCNILPFCHLGDGSMLSSGINISHHTKIDDFVFISIGVTLGAFINVEKHSFLGVASSVMTGVKYIRKNSLIGAGSVVIRDVPDNAVVVGNPAKILKYQNYEI